MADKGVAGDSAGRAHDCLRRFTGGPLAKVAALRHSCAWVVSIRVPVSEAATAPRSSTSRQGPPTSISWLSPPQLCLAVLLPVRCIRDNRLRG